MFSELRRERDACALHVDDEVAADTGYHGDLITGNEAEVFQMAMQVAIATKCLYAVHAVALHFGQNHLGPFRCAAYTVVPCYLQLTNK